MCGWPSAQSWTAPLFDILKIKRCTDFNGLFICITMASLVSMFPCVPYCERRIIGAIDWSRYRNSGPTVQLLTNCSASKATKRYRLNAALALIDSMVALISTVFHWLENFDSEIQKNLCSLCGQTCVNINCSYSRIQSPTRVDPQMLLICTSLTFEWLRLRLRATYLWLINTNHFIIIEYTFDIFICLKYNVSNVPKR